MNRAVSFLDRRRYLLLSLVVMAMMLVHYWNGQWSKDFWDHAAAVRELMANPLDPGHPQLPIEAPHVSFSPYTLMVAGIARLFSLDPITTLEIFGPLNLMLVLAGLWSFSRLITRNRLAPFYALLFTLVLWGPVTPWRYSGFLNLNALGFVIPLPSMFALGLTLFSLAAFTTFLRTGGRWPLVLVVVAFPLVLLTHPLTAVILGLGLAALTWFEPITGVDHRAGLALLIIAVVGLIVASLWPYYPFWDLVLGESAVFHPSNLPMYERPLLRILPALLALPLLVRRRIELPYSFLGVMVVGLGAIYLYGFLTDSWSYGRVIAGVALMLHLALGDYTGELELRARAGNQRARVAMAALPLLLVATSLSILPGAIRSVPRPLLPASIRDDPRLVPISSRYEFVREYVEPDEVILADPDTGWPTPAFGARVITTDFNVAFVDDGPQRYRDLVTFFNPGSSRERRLQVLEKHDVDLVLLRSDQVDLLPFLERVGMIVYRDDAFILVRLSGSLS